jgi:hypothetical protein
MSVRRQLRVCKAPLLYMLHPTSVHIEIDHPKFWTYDWEREQHEEENRKQETPQTDNFFTTQQKNQWAQRTIQLRQQIDRLYTREREAERAGEQATTAGVGAASTAGTITLDKAVQVKVKYGTATIPAGTTLTIVSRDANGVTVQYLGENVLLPP